VTKLSLLTTEEIISLAAEVESYLKDVETLVNREHFGKIMLKNFIKYARLLDMNGVKMNTKDGKITLDIREIPFTTGKARNLFRARRDLMIKLRNWKRLHARLMREAEPYMVAEAL
jgi:hypothetical protein